MFISVGFLVLLVAIGLKLWYGNATWIAAVAWFTAGVLLAGSTAALIASGAANNTVRIGHTIITSVGGG